MQNLSPHPRQNISIIIPVGQGDSSWRQLIRQLVDLAWTSEVIIAATDAAPADFPLVPSWQWLVCSRGRPQQMNAAAQIASGDYLWFLHADSIIENQNLESLSAAIGKYPKHLLFFRLGFANGSRLMRLTEMGVAFRSGVLKLPFGDQGLCIAREVFYNLGKFTLDWPFGEDHHFVWKCHLNKIGVFNIASTLKTSPRKYQDRGWFKTTQFHLRSTVKQAAPMIFALIKKRFFRSRVLK